MVFKKEVNLLIHVVARLPTVGINGKKLKRGFI